MCIMHNVKLDKIMFSMSTTYGELSGVQNSLKFDKCLAFLKPSSKETFRMHLNTGV